MAERIPNEKDTEHVQESNQTDPTQVTTSAGSLTVFTAANTTQEVEKDEDSTTGVADLPRLFFDALDRETTTVKNRRELVGNVDK